MKYLTYYSALILLFTVGSCRDYITDVIDRTPPTVAVNGTDFNGGDTISITLINNSNSSIYVTGAYDLVEKKISNEWIKYAISPCGSSCPEFAVQGKNYIVDRDILANDAGVYRIVCAYSIKSGEPYEQKPKVYSSEFTVHQR